MAVNDVVITGIGIVTSLGEGVQTHRDALFEGAPQPVVDVERFAPHRIHPCPEIDWSQQISKRDQRQMELWQKLGVYAAGLALDDAGVKDDEAICGTMDMIVAAGGGERDVTVDSQILDRVKAGESADHVINDVLTTELRPTLFLAQLSNLLAGNISIVHKVTGSSRTFMGEELAGLSALQTAAARIRAGQSSHALVGGSMNGEHADMLLSYQLGGYLNQGADTGVATGSSGVFFVLESREHAANRGAKIYAQINDVSLSRMKRKDDYPERLKKSITSQINSQNLIISGNSGAEHANNAEKQALSGHNMVRNFAALVGHSREVQPFLVAAIAALAIDIDKAPAPFTAHETVIEDTISQAHAVIIGFHRGEGTITLAKA